MLNVIQYNILLILSFCLGIWLEFFPYLISLYLLMFCSFLFYSSLFLHLFLLVFFFVYVFIFFKFGCFAGTCTPAISPVCGALGKSIGSWFYKSWRHSASSSLCTVYVPMPVYRRAFEMQTTRQV